MKIKTLTSALLALSVSAGAYAPLANADELPSGDMYIEAIEFSEDEIAKLSAYSAIDANDHASLSASPASFFSYGNDYAYDSLSDLSKSSARRKLYRKLLSVNQSMETSTSNLSAASSTLSNISTISTLSYQLTLDETTEVVYSFQYDHPEYYWLPCAFGYSMNGNYVSNVVVVSFSEFALYSMRENFTDRIESSFTQILDMIDEYGYDCPYEKVRFIHDIINANTYYMYDSSGTPSQTGYAHGISGALDGYSNTGSVCEGYAKAFQLLCNGAGVDSYYIVGIGGGGAHAWNMARMDDGHYYYFDTTWDDVNDTYNYFAAGRSFNNSHSAYSPTGSGNTYLYDLPSAPSYAYEHEAHATPTPTPAPSADARPTKAPTAAPSPTPTPDRKPTASPTPVPASTPVPDISVHANVSGNTAIFSFETKGISDDAVIYASGCDPSGRLVRVASCKAAANCEISFDLTQCDSVNIYIWSKQNEPITVFRL